MVRTTLSFCVLFGCLIAGLALLQQPTRSAKSLPETAPATGDSLPKTTQRPARKFSLLPVSEKSCSAEDFGVMLVSHDEVVSDEEPTPAEKPAEEKAAAAKPEEAILGNSLRGEESAPDEVRAEEAAPEESKTEEKPVEPLPLDRLIEDKPQLTP
ncbi:MAG TPA: hypothetical protein VFW62_07630, partial [bacterium]|nr:hypothetical protein [bacterium]